MAPEDRRRWNERYRLAPGDRPRPRAELVAAADDLPAPGRALDLACGRGAEAVWLAERGWSVDAVDLSDEALAAVRRWADEAGVGDRLHVVQADLDDGLPDACGTGYDLVVMGHFRSPVLAEAVRRCVRPGGLVITSRLSVVGRSGPDSPFLAGPGELGDLARSLDLEVVRLQEGGGQTSLVARTRTPDEGDHGSPGDAPNVSRVIGRDPR